MDKGLYITQFQSLKIVYVICDVDLTLDCTMFYMYTCFIHIMGSSVVEISWHSVKFY